MTDDRKQTKTTVAVIVVNYNAGHLLAQCLKSVDAQTVRPLRVLVMDNGSRDGSFDRCRADFPSVEFHALNGNLGFAKANNLAVDLVADCEWVALLNPDAFPDPEWIESFHKGLTQHPQASSFACYMLSAQFSGIIDGAGDAYRVDGVAWPLYQGHRTTEMPHGVREVFAPCAGAAFYRRESFLGAGGFEEKFFCYHEDVDLGFRMRLMGLRCWFLEDAVVRHVGSAITGKGSDFSLYHVHRNIVWTYVRNMPGPYLWIYLPAHVLLNVGALCWFTYCGRGRVIWRAKADAIRMLSLICRQRRKIQSARRVPSSVVISMMEHGTVLSSIVPKTIKRLGALFQSRPAE